MGSLSTFTRSLVAGDSLTLTESAGVTYISVLCKTDNSGSNGVTVTGGGTLAGTASNAIVLNANESITIQAPSPYDIGDLTISCGTGSTGIVVSM